MALSDKLDEHFSDLGGLQLVGEPQQTVEEILLDFLDPQVVEDDQLDAADRVDVLTPVVDEHFVDEAEGAAENLQVVGLQQNRKAIGERAEKSPIEFFEVGVAVLEGAELGLRLAGAQGGEYLVLGLCSVHYSQ